MSYDLLRSAKHVRGLTNAEFRVLFYLLEAANNASYECFPSIKRIASFVEMGERTVQRHISALADRGLFEKVEQRRSDGSRSVNCYRFIVSGTIKVGRQSVIQLGPDEDDQQPANNGGLHNRPFQTGGGVTQTTTPRQEWRDIDQELEPGISPLSSNEDKPPHSEKDLFGEDVKTAEQMQAEAESILVDQVFTRWKKLVADNPQIAELRGLSDVRRKAIIDRGDLAMWESAFLEIEQSRFLRGLSKPGRDRDEPMVVTFDWLLKPRNFVKVVEGNYRDKRALDDSFDPASGRRLTAVEQAVRNVSAGIRTGRERRGFGVGGRGADAGAPRLTDGRARDDTGNHGARG